jgi:thioredoxin reductase (NADPH)
MQTLPHTPIALVGAGPLGIELAIAMQKADLQFTHLEAAQVGATMQWWPHGTRWFSSNERISIAGVPLVTPLEEKASREEYLAYLRSIVLQFDLQIRTYTKVTEISKPPHALDAPFTLTLQHALFPDAPITALTADKVILATGGTATPNLLHIPGEDFPHVSHYFHDPHVYFQKSLLIVGGRNSAVEAALRCQRAGAKVHLSYRGPNVDAKDIKYWLYPEFAALTKSGAITPHFRTCPTAITATHVTLSPSSEGAGVGAQDLPIDFVLLLTGYNADMSLARSAGITLSGRQQLPTFNPDTMETNVPNLYIAGTAIAGTQGGSGRGYKVFLENCHIHVPRIVRHLTHQPPPAPQAAPNFERPES